MTHLSSPELVTLTCFLSRASLYFLSFKISWFCFLLLSIFLFFCFFFVFVFPQAELNCSHVKCFTIYLLAIFQHHWLFFSFLSLLIVLPLRNSTTMCIRLSFTHKIRLVGSPSRWLRNYSSCCFSKSDINFTQIASARCMKGTVKDPLHLFMYVNLPLSGQVIKHYDGLWPTLSGMLLIWLKWLPTVPQYFFCAKVRLNFCSILLNSPFTRIKCCHCTQSLRFKRFISTFWQYAS